MYFAWNVSALSLSLALILSMYSDGRLLESDFKEVAERKLYDAHAGKGLRNGLPALWRKGKTAEPGETTIIIKDDGPTLLGTQTNLNVSVQTFVKGNIFISYYTYQPYRDKEIETPLRFYEFSITDWQTVGSKLVYVRVKYKDIYNRMVVLGTNYTSVDVSKYALCTISVWQNGSRIFNGSISLGNVDFSITLHDPNKVFEHGNISTVWSFNDGSPLVFSNSSEVSHLFSREGSFKVQVLALIVVGGQKYYGNGNVFIDAVSRVKYEIIVWQKVQTPEPRIPSGDQCVSTGKSFFYVQVMDPFNILKSANFSYHWKFGGTRENLSKDKFISYTFDAVGHQDISVDVVAVTRKQVFSSTVEKRILVQDPVHSIAINGKSIAEKGELLTFNVTCEGSPPVSFCWYISEGGCQLPQNVMCSPTVLYKSCWSVFFHKFRYSGRFCLNVSVVNTVSFVHRQVQVVVKGVPEEDNRHIVVIAATLPVVIVLLLVIIVTLVVKHTRRIDRMKNKKRSETAKFDFRFSNSFDSWSASGRCSQPGGCFPGLTCGYSFMRTGEKDPDDPEEQLIFSDPSNPATPQRKTSYYGTIHMNLLQRNHNNSIAPRDDDDLSTKENWANHSV